MDSGYSAIISLKWRFHYLKKSFRFDNCIFFHGIGCDRAMMDTPVTQCKVRQCSSCLGETEFFCIPCLCDLCLKCKENHANHLNTFDHNVVNHCEKIQCTTEKNNNAKNADREHEIYSRVDESDSCSYNTEYDRIMSDNTYFKKRRHQQREIIKDITRTLFYRSVLLKAMIYDVKTCQKEWSYCESKIASLKSSIDKLHLCKKYFPHRCLKQKAKQKQFLAKIQIVENKHEKSSTNPLYFLSHIKRTRIPEIQDSKACAKHCNIFLNESFFKEKIVVLLSKFKMNESETRDAGNELLMKLTTVPELQKSFTVTGLEGCDHISYATPDRVWVSYGNNLILANTEESIVHYITDLCSNAYTGGLHAVNSKQEIIYVDKYNNVNKVSNDMKTKAIFVQQNDTTWKFQCVYCSRCTDDLFIGMYKDDPMAGKIARYNLKGKLTQTIQTKCNGKKMYFLPCYVTENNNGDVIVSDSNSKVVVTSRRGVYRFSYTGHIPGSKLSPQGIATDALSQILVCDNITYTIQVISQNGQFLAHLLIRPSGIFKPCNISYDFRNHRLWVGSDDTNRVCVYKYRQRQDALISKS